MALSRTGVDVMSKQYFTRPNVKPVITYIGTTPEQRQMSTDEFKAKFDEMTVNLQNYIKETLLTELDAFKQEFMTLNNDVGLKFYGPSAWNNLTDANDVTNTIAYVSRLRCSNLPSGLTGNGVLITMRHSNAPDGHGIQFFIEVYDTRANRIYFRQCIEGNWKPWYRLTGTEV